MNLFETIANFLSSTNNDSDVYLLMFDLLFVLSLVIILIRRKLNYLKISKIVNKQSKPGFRTISLLFNTFFLVTLLVATMDDHFSFLFFLMGILFKAMITLAMYEMIEAESGNTKQANSNQF